MKIETTRFGDIEIKETEIISFKEGVLGFENLKEYVIFEMEDGAPLMWMQSATEPSLAFIIIRPFEFNDKYTIDISDGITEALKLEKSEDADVFAIVVIPEDPSNMTANLQGPIIINNKNKMAKQIISTNSRHKIKHYILEEMQNNRNNEQGGK